MFYAGAWLAHASPAQLTAQGWLIGAVPLGSGWHFPLAPDHLALVHWSMIGAQAGNLATILLITVIALLLNASGLELVVRQDIDLNHELSITGLANIASALAGGMIGYAAISSSSLNQRISGGKRLVGVLTALGVAVTVLAGASLFAYIPRFVLGGVLIFLGLSFLVEWVIQAWSRFSRIEFAIIVGILIIIATRGFLEGVAAGLVAAIILFVISSSRISVVKHTLTGADVRSRVSRSPDQRRLLEERGQQLYILQLQGFIFFGTANRLYEQLREWTRRAEAPSPRFVVLEFAQVVGLDSTALRSFTRILQLAMDCHTVLVLTGLSSEIRRQFTLGGFEEQPGVLRIFPDLDRGIEWCEEQIIAAASPGQRVEKDLQRHLEAILPVPGQLSRLLRYVERRQVTAGETIIRQGDESDFVVFVESGQVTAQLVVPGRDPVRLETMRGGRMVGELGFYLGTRRSAAVVADEPGVVYLLSKRSLEQMEESDPEAATTFHRIVVHLLGERVLHLMRAVDALQK